MGFCSQEPVTTDTCSHSQTKGVRGGPQWRTQIRVAGVRAGGGGWWWRGLFPLCTARGRWESGATRQASSLPGGSRHRNSRCAGETPEGEAEPWPETSDLSREDAGKRFGGSRGRKARDGGQKRPCPLLEAGEGHVFKATRPGSESPEWFSDDHGEIERTVPSYRPSLLGVLHVSPFSPMGPL